MRRPRHREKSNLLWKMIGVAGAVNLIIWPVLIHEGVFAGVRHETLIPVHLISLPPSTKPPDTLQRVSHAATPLSASVSPAPTTVHAFKPVKPVILTTMKTLTPPKPHVASSVVRIAAQPSHPMSPPLLAKPVSTISHAPKPHPVLVGLHPTPYLPAHATRVALADRLARAKQLENEGHIVAEEIVRQRNEQASLAPTTPDEPKPFAVAEIPDGMGDLPATKPGTITVVTPSPPKPAPIKTFVPSSLTRAVAVSKSYPSVPDRMMTSSWHATFRGRFTVHPDGTATAQMVSSTGHPVLDERAMEAARRWKFHPARQNGKAVASSQPFVFEYDVHATR